MTVSKATKAAPKKAASKKSAAAKRTPAAKKPLANTKTTKEHKETAKVSTNEVPIVLGLAEVPAALSQPKSSAAPN